LLDKRESSWKESVKQNFKKLRNRESMNKNRLNFESKSKDLQTKQPLPPRPTKKHGD